MEKELIVSRLQATIDKLKTLNPDQFSYDTYVEDFDFNKNCGTVCCVAGWYPSWFPKSDLKYYPIDGQVELRTASPKIGITGSLMDYHGLGFDIIRGLFYGDGIEMLNINDLSTYQMKTTKIKDVIKRFEIVKQYIVNYTADQ